MPNIRLQGIVVSDKNILKFSLYKPMENQVAAGASILTIEPWFEQIWRRTPWRCYRSYISAGHTVSKKKIFEVFSFKTFYFSSDGSDLQWTGTIRTTLIVQAWNILGKFYRFLPASEMSFQVIVDNANRQDVLRWA